MKILRVIVPILYISALVGGFFLVVYLLDEWDKDEFEDKWNRCIDRVSESIKNKDKVGEICEKLMEE